MREVFSLFLIADRMANQVFQPIILKIVAETVYTLSVFGPIKWNFFAPLVPVFVWKVNSRFSCLQPHINRRIWDTFLIDGEIYALRVGLGILRYFENELVMSTFNEAIEILLYP